MLPAVRGDRRGELIRQIGGEIVRFQDGANAVDQAAAEVLALDAVDLRCLSLLLYGGGASPAGLAEALQLKPATAHSVAQRLELAGYAHRVKGRLEITPLARQWIETIWGPLQAEGAALLARESTATLANMARFMGSIGPIQERHAARIRSLLEVPSARRPANRLRGGLSPAASRRVQLFVEANLASPLTLAQLAARAGLSAFHFARAFKQTMGVTPRAWVEQRRVERARELLATSAMPLAQIAVVVGLGSQSRMTTVFRKATGFTPAAYRRGVGA